jgi:hypothetical protein
VAVVLCGDERPFSREAAASSAARGYLGFGALCDGEPVDLVSFDDDPRDVDAEPNQPLPDGVLDVISSRR